MILVCFGTRPEIIKLSPLIRELADRGFPHKLVFTGQHKELYDDVRSLIPDPDYQLKIMKHNQTPNYVLASILTKMDDIISKEKPDLIIVQGDTTTVLAAALSAFNNKVAIGHVEAGLRTYDLGSPFPEEANRQLVSRIATLNWAPTNIAAKSLRKEGVNNIILTGNTVIDACLNFEKDIKYGHQVLVTLHRRENFGEKMKGMFEQIEQLAQEHSHLEFVFPMHPNPKVQQYRNIFEKVMVLDPLNYQQMIDLLSRVRFVISDSGGIQEESAAFKKKILVCRNTTERPEGVQAGFAKLVDDRIIENFDWANDQPVWEGVNPYGNGDASKKIVDSINRYFQVKSLNNNASLFPSSVLT